MFIEDILIPAVAKGARAESLLDDNSRSMFHNIAVYHRLYPDAVRKPAEYCAPMVEDGALLERVRRRIVARAGSLLPADAHAANLRRSGKTNEMERQQTRGHTR